MCFYSGLSLPPCREGRDHVNGARGSGYHAQHDTHDQRQLFVRVALHAVSSGGRVLGQPFRCCMLPDFVVPVGEGALQELREELLKLKFHPKNNDLYQFSQVCGRERGALVHALTVQW